MSTVGMRALGLAPRENREKENTQMGQFIVHVDAVGNHGCQRERKDGEHVVGCEQSNCTDCIAREYVRRLKRAGTMVSAATITHWPGTDSEVRDDLLSGRRSGSF